MTDQRVADYFIVAGLPENPTSLNDDLLKQTGKHEPITDICVIFPSENEECPPGYTLLLETPTGMMADLNHGSIRSPEVFLCYRRGRDKPPLTDVGVLYEGKERVLPGCEVIYHTPYGRPANINNTQNFKIFLTYRRANDSASSDTLSVTDIRVVITSKNETAPHSFCMIDKNLNKGTLMGSDIYLCYKKSMCKDHSITFKPAVLSRYPSWDYKDFPLPEDSVAMFGLPMGAAVESWLESALQPKPVFSTFILTGMEGNKIYGAAVTFYEPYSEEKLTEQQKKDLGLHRTKKRKVHANKTICLLARKPFFNAFKQFLHFLFRLTTLSKEPSEIPVEKYISHLMWQVPFPSPERPRVWMELNAQEKQPIMFALPEESPIPQSGADFSSMLKNLGAENTVNLLTYTLLEHKLLVHSLRPAVLTGVIEAIGSMIFPFNWQCTYIPLCPLGLADVLWAPVPYIVGVDSRYFDLYEQPSDVTFVDLDTNTIKQSDDRLGISYKMLPKRPVKVLRSTLEKIYNQMREDSVKTLSQSQDSLDDDVKKLAKRAAIDTAIQEAFLRFMAAILKGYKSYLLPITSETDNHSATDARALFDMQGFLKSRDKAYHKLFKQMLRTQSFTRFIEERSFNIRNDTSLAFFDECTEKVDENYDQPRLLEPENIKSEHTVFVSPPLPDENNDGTWTQHNYTRFPSVLNPELFPCMNQTMLQSVQRVDDMTEKKIFVARRTKAEIKLAQKVAKSSKEGVAVSPLWAKCLISNSFSLWFVHLASFVKVSSSVQSSMRTAFAILKKMQEYRLHTPDEVCYRTMMQLCGIHSQPVLAVKVLCEMKEHGLTVNAVTYGYYNKAVLESRWPSETSNGLVLWRKLRHVITGVARFRKPLRDRSGSLQSLGSANSEAEYDALSRDSVDSAEVLADKVKHKDDGVSSASDKGYSSMSQEDLRRERLAQQLQVKCKINNGQGLRKPHHGKQDAFRMRVGSIVKCSVSNLDVNFLHGIQLDCNSAGLLLTTTHGLGVYSDESYDDDAFHDDDKMPLGITSRDKLAEAKRKRHRSAGDHLKPSAVRREMNTETILEMSHESSQTGQSDNPNNLPKYKAEASDNKTASIINDENITDDPLLTPSATSLKKSLVTKDDPLGLFISEIKMETTQLTTSTSKTDSLKSDGSSTPSVKSMDIGNLFGRESPKKIVSKPDFQTPEQNGVKKYTLLDFSPEQELPPGPLIDNKLKKSMSLDSRSSYKEALQESDSASIGSEDHLQRKRDSLDRRVSEDSLIASTGNLSSVTPKKQSYKSWIASSIKKSSNAALGGMNISGKFKDIMYGKGKDPDHEPSNIMSSRESLDQNNTPKKPQAHQKTVSRAVVDGYSPSLKKIKSVSNSMASKLYSNYNKLKHTVKEYQSPSTITTPYKSESRVSDAEHDDESIGVKPFDLMSASSLSSVDDFMSALDEKSRSVDVSISFNSVSSAFIDQYLPLSDHVDGKITNYPVMLDISMCSTSACSHCSSILFDEEIMAGWSSQDSDLNTSCPLRGCARKLVPFLTINVKDYRKRVRANTVRSPRKSRLISFTSDTEEFMFDCLSEPLPRTEKHPVLNSISEIDNASDTLRPELEPIVVPYLSPLVLRKELENVLESEGDGNLTSSVFVDEHPIIYWNLVWYFKRLNLPSHMPHLLFGATSILQDCRLVDDTIDYDPRNLRLRAVWDNFKFHDKLGIPMYRLWQDTDVKSSVVEALVTDNKAKSRGLLQQILTHIDCNDMYIPLRLLVNSRQHLPSKTHKYHSAYRDILFLSFTYFGRTNLDHDAFDREYKLAFKRLTLAERQKLQESDFPPTPSTIWCRKLFGDLEVSS